MKIQTVESPGGISAWLVEDHSIPKFALHFGFDGGSSQDPQGKEGVANFGTRMLLQGAGDLGAVELHERFQDLAIQIGFSCDVDGISGALGGLSDTLNEGTDLLRLALSEPRYDATEMDRVRAQFLATQLATARDPNQLAGSRWEAIAFAGHPYGRAALGTEASVSGISAADLGEYRGRVFARNTLKVVAVGDITADQLKEVLDKTFGALPAESDLASTSPAVLLSGGRRIVVDIDIPQSIVTFGKSALPQSDPDFMPALVLNHILGGGGFASRLMEEVRVKRGLAYSVSTGFALMRHASLLRGGVATRNETAGKALDVIYDVLRGLSDGEISETDLDNGKSYLIGSYPLNFEGNANIASRLLGYLAQDLGPDFVDERNDLVAAVTLDDLKRVAKTLLNPDDLFVTIVGRPALAEVRAASPEEVHMQLGA